MKRIRRVALLHPFQLPISLAMFGVAILFTAFPEALEHTPVSFETRGIIHHLFHYSLLIGGALSVIGLFLCGRLALPVEFVGLLLLAVALALNLTALVSAELNPEDTPPLSGLVVALRLAVLGGIGVRMFIILTQATVELPAKNTDA